MKKHQVISVMTLLSLLIFVFIFFLTGCENCKNLFDPCESTADCCGYDMSCLPDITGHTRCEIPVSIMNE